jgi:hypothetical protein
MVGVIVFCRSRTKGASFDLAIETCAPLAYKKLDRWPPSAVAFDMVMEDSSDPVVTIRFIVPGGALLIMGEPEEVGRVLIVKGTHIGAQGLKPNDVGIANLRMIAEAVMRTFDYDEIRVEGEVRTTGANRGHRPRPFRFFRDDRIDARPRPEPGESD